MLIYSCIGVHLSMGCCLHFGAKELIRVFKLLFIDECELYEVDNFII